ncbi:MAG: P1 family peptidase [Clostridiales bacterium]|nr:P1 family peptidase [Clostridiales bacterium]
MEEISWSCLQGIRIGHAQNIEAGTGCTVILCEEGCSAGVDVRGGAPGTRETDLLNPVNMIEKIHGIVLTGGSAFGLDAASGVMRYLEEKGIGYDTGFAKVPIVPAAVLYDLNCGSADIRPDGEMGYKACLAAVEGAVPEGNEGAGTGATVGKILGPESAMKGGLGAYCCKVGELVLGAVVAVNCMGDVVSPSTGEIIAGVLKPDGKSFAGTENTMLAGYSASALNGNTTIGAVITNGSMTKAQANKVASMSHDGFARTINPIHTMYDGDTIFALSTGRVEADVNIIGLLAARAVEQAILRAVRAARTLHGYVSCNDLEKHGG